MALILNIDTAQEQAGLFLARDGYILASDTNQTTKDHATWIHEAIRALMHRGGCRLDALDAVAITAGPGSYTGLRIGMATAKGLCYALQIPLITESTLKVMAAAALEKGVDVDLVCPMIDARRMEVFTAVYSSDLTEIFPPKSIILENDFFLNSHTEEVMFFCGSGAEKWSQICKRPHAVFYTGNLSNGVLANLSYELFQQSKFAELTYAEPYYLKDFHTYPKTDSRQL